MTSIPHEVAEASLPSKMGIGCICQRGPLPAHGGLHCLLTHQQLSTCLVCQWDLAMRLVAYFNDCQSSQAPQLGT